MSVQFTPSNGDRSGVDNKLILISDGYSNVLEGDTPSANAAEQLKATGVDIYTVAVSDSSNLVELNNINSDPDSEHLFRVDAATDYKTTADRLLDRLCE